jgi:chitin disaccharide deacetylase
METLLVVNADDFGLSRGVNRGIVEAHQRGVVTSASLMVDAPLCREAVAMSSDCPNLGLGLHFVATDERGPLFDLDDATLLHAQLLAQVEKFVDAVGAHPTHIDSHHHVHGRKPVAHVFREFAAEHHLPLRKHAPARYWGFYAQWAGGVSEPAHVSVEMLQAILSQLPPGAHEIGCHPGYVSDDVESAYLGEREWELTTLTDPRVRQTVRDCDIVLMNYRELVRRLDGVAAT